MTLAAGTRVGACEVLTTRGAGIDERGAFSIAHRNGYREERVGDPS